MAADVFGECDLKTTLEKLTLLTDVLGINALKE